MSIKVLFFGATADIVGRRELVVDAATNSADLIDQLAFNHPQLASHKLLVAVNQEHASTETKINDGDEIAVFTPVSGG